MFAFEIIAVLIVTVACIFSCWLLFTSKRDDDIYYPVAMIALFTSIFLRLLLIFSFSASSSRIDS